MIVVVMGVSGCGKSTVGELLARRLGCPFSDADAFHPPANVEKMSRGLPLTDEDRWPWLRAIRAAIATSIARGEDHVLACSALKESYRRLLSDKGDVTFVHLTGDPALIGARLAARTGHFFDPALLQSQLDTLEPPADAVTVNIALGPEQIVAELMRVLRPHHKERTMRQADMGLVGLGVMGRNLAANLADHGTSVAGYDLDAGRRAAFAAQAGSAVPCASAEEMLAALRTPRVILMMVPAGPAVDELMAALLPALAPGDVLIDGGNSHFRDTGRRTAQAAAAGVHYVGLGVSGGEEGARRGPALMAGGTPEAIAPVAPLLTAIAARAADGTPCFERVGPEGAGHFVKMIHNGIEYADMQLIAEAYHLLRHLGGFSYERLAETFAAWNQGELASYLMEITASILRTSDPQTGRPILEVIRDAAGQKGTGHWAATTALELGMPAPTIAEAVHARCLSGLKEERERAAAAFPALSPAPSAEMSGEDLVAAVGDALLCGRTAVYAQGFAVIAAGSRQFGWDVDLAAVASVWRAGCIIRARLVERIRDALVRTPDLPNIMPNIMFDPDIAALMGRGDAGFRRTVAAASLAALPVPAMASALSYWDGWRSGRLWANMIQAQRDFFGAHGYERTDRPGMTHTEWG